MKRVIFLPVVARDLAEIAAYIAQDNRARAASFVEELQEHARYAASHPRRFRIRYRKNGDVRAAAHGRYRIYFREEVDRVVVLRVLHTTRDARRLLE